MTVQLFSEINHPVNRPDPYLGPQPLGPQPLGPRPITHRGGYRPEFSTLAERVMRLLAADSPNSKRNKSRGEGGQQVITKDGYNVKQSGRQGQTMTQRMSVDQLDKISLAGQLVGHEVVLELNYGGEHYAVVRTTPPMPVHTSTQTLTGAPPLLSPREEEIVWLVAQGCPDKVIADKLQISRWTVGTHLRRIFAKLTVNSRAEMVAVAVQQMGVGV